MLYNDLINYNQANITYTGVVRVNVSGISDPIILSDITVVISVTQDFSNATTVGYVTFDYVPNGIITIDATQDQADALITADIIYINSTSGEVAIQSV